MMSKVKKKEQHVRQEKGQQECGLRPLYYSGGV